MDHFVYILRCADGSLYTGYARDLARREEEHNSSPLGAKYTRGRRPVKLIYSERLPTRSAALKREAEIKRLTRTQKLSLIK
ncbi:MAG: GIY-YIG nuclease family protein [Candidatus Paceibacterota bacterium]